MLNVRIHSPEVQKLSPKITVVGIGGAGGNAVNNMISSGLEGCEFLVCNTDAQALEGSLCEDKLQLGASVTGGLGAGAKPEIGEKAAHESLDDVMQYLEGSNMAFITAGMGGGTGTGAAPVIAKACRDSGILTVGVVTKPFHFEGTHRMTQADAGIEQMQDYVDTLIVIPNQNLFRVANEKTTFAEAFKMADGVLQSGVRGVTDLMVMPGLINLDFADIRSAMLEMGKAMMGTGEGEGDRRAIEAAEAAINNPLLDDVSMKGARGVIINVTGGQDMTLFEVDEACNRIRDEVDPNANIIFGSTFEEKLEGRMRVSIVATGIEAESARKSYGGTKGMRVTALGKSAEEKQESSSQVAEKKPVLSTRVQPNVMRSMTLDARQMRAPEEVSAPTAQAAEFTQQPVSSAGTPQAELHQGNFIPPNPVVPEPREESGYAPLAQGYQVHLEQPHPEAAQTPLRAPVEQAQIQAEVPRTATENTSSLVLRPPVPGAKAAEPKKSPSLFERITGAYRGEGAVQASDSQLPPAGFHGGEQQPQGDVRVSTQPSHQPSQGRLNIDSPAAPAQDSGGEDLNIPAFLRRQAN
ncbi:MAG: cell division protein FtsZ [Alphaproteobacteria bacterium]|nr:cell division protein FtsZ [Alphaproteobacteria bacterium]